MRLRKSSRVPDLGWSGLMKVAMIAHRRSDELLKRSNDYHLDEALRENYKERAFALGVYYREKLWDASEVRWMSDELNIGRYNKEHE